MNGYDVLIVGSGAGGGTLAHRLASSGASILILERGDWLSHTDVGSEVDPSTSLDRGGPWATPDVWYTRDGAPFRPLIPYCVGGATTMFGAALHRLREQDFRRLHHHGGLSPGWPISYEEFEPYYSRAEQLYQVHGIRGEDPSDPPTPTPYVHPALPFGRPTQGLSDALSELGLHPFHVPRGLACITTPCRPQAPTNPEMVAVRPALARSNVSLIRNARVRRLETDSSGRSVTSVLADVDGKPERFTASLVVVSAGAANSALLLLASASSRHPRGLANGSDLVGRNYLRHNRHAVPALTDISVADWPHPLGLNDFYLGDEDFEHPMGSVHLATGSGSLGGGSIGRDSVAFMLTCEDLPDRGNRLRLQDDGHLVLHYVPNNGEPVQQLRRRVLEHLQAVGGHLLHVPSADERVRQRLTTQPTLLADQAGTARFGEDPSTSVLDVNCRAHEVDNLYVVDASFFPSIGAVDPALTVIANALRVGDRLVSRLGPSSRRAAS